MAAATDLRYLGEDASDQRIRFQILGNLLPEYDALVTALTHVTSVCLFILLSNHLLR